MDTRERVRGSWAGWRFALFWLSACVSSHETTELGGESHFLRHCEAECGGGLDCIDGVCTRGCVAAEGSCGDLFAGAVCTEGADRGGAAACDVRCARDADCSALSPRYACASGVCRLPSASSGGDASVTGGVPGSDAGATGGASGEDAGAAGDAGGPVFPYPTERLFECPRDVESDPVEVTRSLVQADTLVVDLRHGGGCAPHAYAVCFESLSGASSPVQSTLRVIHEGNGDPCDALLSAERRIDLTPLAERYERDGLGSAGIIATNLGTYAFGALSCADRARGAQAQVADYARAVSRSCTSADDCTWAGNSTRCDAQCGVIASNEGAAELTQWLEVTSSAVCGDYEADGCGPVVIPPCVPPRPLVCASGECVEE